MNFKPMLSGQAPKDLSEIKYPVYVSRKLDGIRAIALPGKGLVSRSLKPIRNAAIQEWARNLPEGVDGELTLPDDTADFRLVDSMVMSGDGAPDFVFHAFDLLEFDNPEEPFSERFRQLNELFAELPSIYPPEWLRHFAVVEHDLAQGPEDIELLHAHYSEAGYEGSMLRSPDGPYKFGRSTEREGYLLKLKNFSDEEADVLGAIEEQQNTNEAVTNALGLTERSSAKAGMVGKGSLGNFVLRLEDGTTFECGSGFTAAQRRELWQRAVAAYNPDLQWTVADHPGAIAVPIGTFDRVTFKHQPPPGGRPRGQKPRIPVFKAFRKEDS